MVDIKEAPPLKTRPPLKNSENNEIKKKELLKALTSLKNGDFSVKLPIDKEGVRI